MRLTFEGGHLLLQDIQDIMVARLIESLGNVAPRPGWVVGEVPLTIGTVALRPTLLLRRYFVIHGMWDVKTCTKTTKLISPVHISQQLREAGEGQSGVWGWKQSLLSCREVLEPHKPNIINHTLRLDRALHRVATQVLCGGLQSYTISPQCRLHFQNGWDYTDCSHISRIGVHSIKTPCSVELEIQWTMHNLQHLYSCSNHHNMLKCEDLFAIPTGQ